MGIFDNENDNDNDNDNENENDNHNENYAGRRESRGNGVPDMDAGESFSVHEFQELKLWQTFMY